MIFGCASIVLVRYNKYSVQNERVAINEIDVQRVSGSFPDELFCQLRRRRKCENEQSAVTLPCLPVSFQHITCAKVGNKYELTSALIGQNIIGVTNWQAV